MAGRLSFLIYPILALSLIIAQVCLYGATASAQTTDVEQTSLLEVSGQITDADGIPIAGVTIRLKGTNNIGTYSDDEGKYRLKEIPARHSDGTLIFTYLGMTTIEEPINGRAVINVTMNEDYEILDEVVVTGYQEIKKERMTGSIATINANRIKNLNIKRIDEILIGSVSGLSAIQSGRPGASASINIRGVNSLNGNDQPIWIIDGMPIQDMTLPSVGTGTNLDLLLRQGGIGNIAPDDIASVTVLKDAAASAIYGARAANGVIVIQTKRGEEGKPSYQLSLQQGISLRPNNNIRMMTTEEKITFERQMYEDQRDPRIGRIAAILGDAEVGLISKAEAEEQIALLSQVNTDWYKEIYSPGYSTQVHGTLSGGSETTQYYTSVNYLHEKGIEINSAFDRAIVTGKLNHQISDTFEVEASLSGTYRQDRQSASVIFPLEYAMYANPYESPEGIDQSWDVSHSSLRPGLLWDTLNAKQDMADNSSLSRYIDLTLNTKLSWKTPLEGLRLSVQGQGNFSSTNSHTSEAGDGYTNFVNNWLQSIPSVIEVTPEMVLGSLNETSLYADDYTLRTTAEYDHVFGGDHIVSLLLGNDLQSSMMYSSSHYAPVFDSLHRTIGIPILPEGTEANDIISSIQRLGTTGKYQSKLSSFFLNGTYSYADRYILSGSVRYDGSDIIGNQNQFTPLWNVSGKWNLHNEPYFRRNDLLTAFALRIGFGYTGSIDKSAFPFVLLTYENSVSYAGQLVPDDFTYANPNIRWQTKQDFNIGFESSWLDDRIQLGINYYRNYVYDLLDSRTLAWSSGQRTVKENAGNLINTGAEVDFSISLLRRGDLHWSLRGNFAYNKNYITETRYKSPTDLGIRGRGSGGDDMVQGYSVGAYFGYRFAGIDPLTGHTLVIGDDGKPFDMDILSNATLDVKAPTPVYLGEAVAPYIGGFSNELVYKGLSLTISFEMRAGNVIPSFNTFRGLDSHNRHISDVTRWRAPGDEAKIPMISNISTAYSKYEFDAGLERGDYLRLTYLSLGYNLPAKWLKGFALSLARITLSTNNLFTITRYKGIDPSLMGRFGYPNTPELNISVNLGF